MNHRMLAFYMSMAQLCAGMSRAARLQVGSVLVKDDNIISFSWNGTPSGWDNNCEDVEYMEGDVSSWLEENLVETQWPNIDADGRRYRLVTKPEVLHSEANVLTKVARSQYSSQGSTLFVTHAPCVSCAKLIYQAGVKQVYFAQYYRTHDGVAFLERAGIPVNKLEYINDTV